MEEHAKDGRPDSGSEMAQPVAREGTSASTQADGGITETRVLARVPALDAVAEGPDTPDGRILGRKLSTKILLAAGVCIVLVATVPYMFNRGNSNSGGESPAPDAPEAPLYGDDESAPGVVQSSQSTSPPLDMNFQAQVPELPAWADAPRAAEGSMQAPSMGEQVRVPVNAIPVTAAPAWDDPQPAAPAWDNPQPAAPTWQTPTAIPHVSDRTPNWGNRSAPPSADPEPLSSAWPNSAQMRPAIAPSNSTPLPTADAAPAYGSRYDHRYDSRTPGATYYRSYREPQTTANRQIVVPQRVAAVETDYRNRHPSNGQATFSPESRVRPPIWTDRQAEPGVARLEGIIEKPSFQDDR